MCLPVVVEVANEVRNPRSITAGVYCWADRAMFGQGGGPRPGNAGEKKSGGKKKSAGKKKRKNQRKSASICAIAVHKYVFQMESHNPIWIRRIS